MVKNIFFLAVALVVIKLFLPALGEAAEHLLLVVIDVFLSIIENVTTQAEVL